MTFLPSPSAPIFIHGIMQRSGTNFLWQLLLMHPQCHAGSVGEDFLLKHAPLLQHYSERLFGHWTPAWRQRYGDKPDAILSNLGGSLISLIERPYYLYPSETPEDAVKQASTKGDAEAGILPQRLVTKTPSVDHLDLFFKLFPHAYLIIIVRDGRSVVESGIKSFGWRFEEAARQWKRAADTIIDFDSVQRPMNNPYLIVKYEELLTKPRETVKNVLTFLRLPLDQYHFDRIDELPIFGSSEIRNHEDAVHWKPIQKEKVFDPSQRWRHWDARRHFRFNWIAGEAMTRLAYALEPVSKGSAFYSVLNRALDLKFRIGTVLRKTRQLFQRSC